jgi:hypothetical protein
VAFATGWNSRERPLGCGKTISAQQNFDGLHVWDRLGLSGYLVCLVHLVGLIQPNKPDQPDRPEEPYLKIPCLHYILKAIDVEPVTSRIEDADGILPFQQFLEQLGDACLAVARLRQEFGDDVGDELGCNG